MVRWVYILLFFSFPCFGQIHEYECQEIEISYHDHLEDYKNYRKTTYITLDLTDKKLSFTQKNAIGNWKMTSYPLRAFSVDEDKIGVAVIKSANLEKVVFNHFKHTITFQFSSGAFWEFYGVTKIR